MRFKNERGRVTCALYNPHYRDHAIPVVVAIAPVCGTRVCGDGDRLLEGRQGIITVWAKTCLIN